MDKNNKRDYSEWSFWSNRWNDDSIQDRRNTKCGKYRPTDDALKYSFIFKNRNKHKEQREERGTIQRTDAKRTKEIIES